MPNIKSAIKRTKTNEKKRLHRAAQKSAMRTTIKKFTLAIENQEKEKAADLLREATRAVDKAIGKGLLHRNAGARKKSQLHQEFQALNG